MIFLLFFPMVSFPLLLVQLFLPLSLSREGHLGHQPSLVVLAPSLAPLGAGFVGNSSSSTLGQSITCWKMGFCSWEAGKGSVGGKDGAAQGRWKLLGALGTGFVDLWICGAQLGVGSELYFRNGKFLLENDF